jgi:hypothetical protein
LLRIDTGEPARFDEHKSPQTRACSAWRDTNTSLRRDGQERHRSYLADLAEGIVEISFDPMSHISSNFTQGLSRALRRIRNTRLVYPREADRGRVWWEESDPEEDPPGEIEHSRSYHTFFVSPDGEGFTFETEGVTEPEFMTDDFAEARS